jgi:hypothetical protein
MDLGTFVGSVLFDLVGNSHGLKSREMQSSRARYMSSLMVKKHRNYTLSQNSFISSSDVGPDH